MRNSPLKTFLLRGFFSWLELKAAFMGLFSQPCPKVVGSDYDEYWRHRIMAGVEPRFDIICESMATGATVLDVGCGDGAMLDHFAKAKGIRGLGIDMSEVAVEKARSRGVDARVRSLEDVCREFGSGSFDHVVISEVLEHVVNPEDFVRMGWQLCKDSLWLTFPNIAYFPHRLRLLAGKFPVQWVLFPGEHVRFWSIADFKHWVKVMELPAPKVLPSNGLIFLGMHRAWPNLFGNQIVVRISKR